MELQTIKKIDYSMASFPGAYRPYIKGYLEKYTVLSPDSIREHLNSMLNRSAATVRLAKCAIKAYSMAHVKTLTQQTIIDNEFKKIKTPLAERCIHAEKVLSDDSINKIMAMKKTSKESAILNTLFLTGLRVSELNSLRYDNCTITNDTVFARVIGKGKKERRVMIPIDLYNEIKMAYNGKVFLFENTQGGRVSRQYINRVINKLAKKAGARAHAHTMRHTFATLQLRRGVSLQKVSNYLGHSSAAITADFYCHDEIVLNDITTLKEKYKGAA